MLAASIGAVVGVMLGAGCATVGIGIGASVHARLTDASLTLDNHISRS